MKLPFHTFGPALMLALLPSALNAQNAPVVLDCTGPTGADAATVLASQKAWAKHLGEVSHEKTFPLDKDGKVGIEMVLLPPGKYYRGEGKNAVLITLTEPLWVGKYEVTQQQYEALMGTNPSHFKRGGMDTAFFSAESMSHISAAKFCGIASENTGAEFRLLREAEWEYAYRAGTRSKFYNGNVDDKLGEIAQYGGNNQKTTEKVGSKASNAFGLFDMAGNVWEWCADYWTPTYDMRTTTDPVGPETGQGFVTRGGSWASAENNCSAAQRGRDAQTYGGSHLGMRIARVPSALLAREKPPILDCTASAGADAKAVVASQNAWARYLGERSHQKAFPLDKAGKVTVEMILLPPGKYYRGDEKNPVIITLTAPLWVGKYEVRNCAKISYLKANVSVDGFHSSIRHETYGV